jgi:dipeptidyl aminopeptidase/acylaminoacyl peptidase
MLNGQWGVVDVQDARSGAEHLVSLGVADAARLVLTGGSAGGYTTLMALTQDPDFWAAGVSLYGIGNLYELKLGSHRFEVNYEQGLIGRLPEAGKLWVERSPLTFVKAVRAPVLLFHGKEDKAVPYQQSVEFADAVKRNGVPVELVLYADEGHGFSREANRKDCLTRTEAFLEKYVVNLQK